MSVDALGNPLRFTLSAGQNHDITEAEALISGYSSRYIIADKGYDSDEFIQFVSENGADAVIPPRSSRVTQRAYDKQGHITGPHRMNLEAVVIYREAAKLIWDKYPKMTLTQVADELTGLPSYMTSSALSPRSPVTLRNYLKGLSPNKAGRPAKGSAVTEAINLAEIVKIMTWK